MDKKDIKYLVLDIDGTLTNSEKEITPRTKEGIIRVMERGHKVILASGRPTAGMMRYAEELEFGTRGGYLLAFNGGCILEYKTGNIMFQKTLPPQVIPGLHRFAVENDCGLVTYLGNNIIVGTRMDEYIKLEAGINGMGIRPVENFVNFVTFDVNKCLMTAPPEKAEALMGKLQEQHRGILSIYRSEPFFIEIMPQNIDKAQSLDRMMSTVGLTKDNCICCGDGFNDMTMIRYAGIGVAMENAQPAIKEAADFITDSNDNDGIVKVIDTFILPEE